MAKKKPEANDQSISFEQSLAELEQIVGNLEGGQLGLADSLAAYELGVKRLNGCYLLLESAERRIELVQNVDAAGQARTTPLDDANDDDPGEKSAARTRGRSARPAPRESRVDDATSLF